jgi:hypothetical protein
VFHRAQVHRIDGQAVKGVGRQCDNVAAPQRLNDLPNQVRLRLVRMDTKYFSDQEADFLQQ